MARVVRRRPIRTARDFWQAARRCEDGCWRFPASPSQPYGSIHRGLAGEALPHRTAWVLKHGPIRAGMMVCHKCDVPNCILPAHLYLGNAQTNHQDACARGRTFRMNYSPDVLYATFSFSVADLFLDEDLRMCVADAVEVSARKSMCLFDYNKNVGPI